MFYETAEVLKKNFNMNILFIECQIRQQISKVSG